MSNGIITDIKGSLENFYRIDNRFYFKWSGSLIKTGITHLETHQNHQNKHFPNGKIIIQSNTPQLGIEFLCNGHKNALYGPAIEWARTHGIHDVQDKEYGSFFAYFLIKNKDHIETRKVNGISYDGIRHLLRWEFLDPFTTINRYKIHFARQQLKEY